MKAIRTYKIIKRSIMYVSDENQSGMQLLANKTLFLVALPGGLNNIFHVFNGLEENIVNKSLKPDEIKT